jgi:hypothetical protein
MTARNTTSRLVVRRDSLISIHCFEARQCEWRNWHESPSWQVELDATQLRQSGETMTQLQKENFGALNLDAVVIHVTTTLLRMGAHSAMMCRF